MTRITPLSANDAKEFALKETMCCARIMAPGKVSFFDKPVPAIQSGEILIKMEGCGVCGSNLPLWEGRSWFSYPLEPGAPGHEGWGRVSAVGSDVSRFKVGDRVSALSCHAFAQFDKAAESDAVLIPDELDNLAFPGEALGCAMNVWERSQIKPGHTVAIVGIGFLGALLCQLAAKSGASVAAISRRRFSLEIARKCGIEHTCFLGSVQETVESVKKIFDNGCDCVIEATGYQHPLTVAGALVKTNGRLIIAGYHQDGSRQIDMQQWNWKGIDVINAHERDHKRYIGGMNKAVEAVINGRLDPGMLYSHSFSFDNLGEAFEFMKNRPDGFLKALVTL